MHRYEEASHEATLAQGREDFSDLVAEVHPMPMPVFFGTLLHILIHVSFGSFLCRQGFYLSDGSSSSRVFYSPLMNVIVLLSDGEEAETQGTREGWQSKEAKGFQVLDLQGGFFTVLILAGYH